jgi:hypothetical protein
MISRRAFLAGGGAVGAAAAAGVVLGEPAWRHDVRQLIHPEPEPLHPVPLTPQGPVIEGAFPSAAMGAVTGWSIAYPHGMGPAARSRCCLFFTAEATTTATCLAATAWGRSFPTLSVRGYRRSRSSGWTVETTATGIDELLVKILNA